MQKAQEWTAPLAHTEQTPSGGCQPTNKMNACFNLEEATGAAGMMHPAGVPKPDVLDAMHQAVTSLTW